MKNKKYGVDVAATRADDLDKKMLAYAKEHPGVSFLDLGCGSGGQSCRLVEAGAKVLAVDIQNSWAGSCSAEFIQADIDGLFNIIKDQQFEACCFQRTIHYLPYSKALKLLQELKTIIKDKLFISVTGLESDIGQNYQDKNKEVEDRFCNLNEAEADIFNLTEPICLYTPEEFMVLVQAGGWTIEEYWVSAFGNIKAICK